MLRELLYMLTTEHIATNASEVLEAIRVAAHRSGRNADAVRLIAVSKTFPAEAIRAAYDAGLCEFGENRVQEFQEKATVLNLASALPGVQFHLIGHLQSNKVSLALGFNYIQTIDSERLARRLNEAAAQQGKRLKVLLQIKLGEELAQEDRKTGAAESDASRLATILGSLDHLDPQGLMLIPPYMDDPEASRPFFRKLRELRDRLRAEGHAWVQELSMGMSHDFPIAIEEGATMVRIGTAIFGPRTKRDGDGAGAK